MSKKPAKLTKLPGAAEYLAVLKRGLRRSGANFGAQAAVSDFGRARLGLIASRKSAPRAVDRNRGKRLMREIFRDSADQLPALDVVVRLKNNLRGSSNAALRTELRDILMAISERVSKSSGISRSEMKTKTNP